MDYKKPFIVLLTVSCVLLGTSTYLYLDRASQTEAIETLSKERDDALAQASGAEETAKKLQGKLNLLAQAPQASAANSSDLSRIIDEKDAEITRLKKSLEQANSQRGNGRGNRREGGREAMQQRMERLKQEDPERYEQIMTAIENRRKQAEDREAKRAQYVDNIDTSRLSYDQQQTVANYRNLLKQQAEQRTAMQNGNANMREVMETGRQLAVANNQIRDILIEQYAGSSAQEIKNIIDATSGGFGGMMMPPPPRQ